MVTVESKNPYTPPPAAPVTELSRTVLSRSKRDAPSPV